MLSTAIGLVVFFGVLAYALQAQTHSWRLLALSYGGGPRRPASAIERPVTIIGEEGVSSGVPEALPLGLPVFFVSEYGG